MPQTPDRFPGAAQEEQTVYEDNGVDPSAPGGITFNGGAFRMWDALGVFNPRSGASTIFGEAYTSQVSEAQSDTTSQVFQNKLTLTTGALNAGTYLIALYGEVRTSSANKVAQVRLQVDAASHAVPDLHPGQANIWVPFGGFIPLPLTAGPHTLTLDWRTVANGYAASIRRARLALWRTT